MNNERIQQLIRFIQEEPGDPFNVYALAIELMPTQPEQARVYFDQLLNQHPTYLPTYYHAAALYATMGPRDHANDLYEKGMALAQTQQNEKTRMELKRAQQAMLDEDEDW